jgi:hypothetical protein
MMFDIQQPIIKVSGYYCEIALDDQTWAFVWTNEPTTLDSKGFALICRKSAFISSEIQKQHKLICISNPNYNRIGYTVIINSLCLKACACLRYIW